MLNGSMYGLRIMTDGVQRPIVAFLCFILLNFVRISSLVYSISITDLCCIVILIMSYIFIDIVIDCMVCWGHSIVVGLHVFLYHLYLLHSLHREVKSGGGTLLHYFGRV